MLCIYTKVKIGLQTLVISLGPLTFFTKFCSIKINGFVYPTSKKKTCWFFKYLYIYQKLYNKSLKVLKNQFLMKLCN